jgi:PQQ-like domain
VGTLIAAVAVTAQAGCGPAQPPAPATIAPATTGPATHTPLASTLPSVSGGKVRALWQGAPWGDLTFDGRLLLGVVDLRQVKAISALTGKPAWTATLPASLPYVLGLVPADGVVIVEAEHSVGQAPALVQPVVSEYIALDAATGARRWAVPVAGRYQSPPIAASGPFVLTGDPAGTVTARSATTGAVVWRDPRPAACQANNFPAIPGVDLVADGPVAVASYPCGRRIAARRLDAATGRVRWTWLSPAAAPADGLQVSVAAVGQDGDVVLLAGQITPTTQPIVSRLPHPNAWPRGLGPANTGMAVLALDAATGQPRWTETGGQPEAFAPTDGAACEVVSAGLECRDDASGAPVMPTLVTGRTEADGPPKVGDGFAGVSAGLAAVILPSRTGGVVLRVVRVRGGGPGSPGNRGQPGPRCERPGVRGRRGPARQHRDRGARTARGPAGLPGARARSAH